LPGICAYVYIIHSHHPEVRHEAFPFPKFKVIPGVEAEVDWARATHDSPYGGIAVAWRKGAGKPLELKVSVPPNNRGHE
jgi:hypothetical protein